jgi:hypothetical protein
VSASAVGRVMAEDQPPEPRRSDKRPRGSPTGQTPLQQEKKTASVQQSKQGQQSRGQQSRRQLTFAWSDTEQSALVEFILLHKSCQSWPADQDYQFWSASAEFVAMRSKQKARSASACRTRVTKVLSKMFHSPLEAERSIAVPLEAKRPLRAASPEQLHPPRNVDMVLADYTGLDSEEASGLHQQLESLSMAFSALAAKHDLSVPKDFVECSIKAMKCLKESGRKNVVYSLAKSLATPRNDGCGPKFPTTRMPMGLLEYMVSFFQAENIQNVPQCPSDYRQWLVTMYSLMGTKWCKLHAGPMWSGQQVSQGVSPVTTYRTEEARVNIPSLSERTLRRDIASASCTTGAEIQTATLDEAADMLPDAVWWLKADGVDVVAGLGESVRLEWSGDVDLNDGTLQANHEAYLQRLKFIETIGLKGEKTFLQDITQLESGVKEDLQFLLSALEDANNSYSSKLASGKTPQKVLFALGWSIDELSRSTEAGRRLLVECGTVRGVLEKAECDRVEYNIPRKLTDLRARATQFVKGVTRLRRVAATHLLVFMISHESRNQKPYALPIQCVPYKGLSVRAIRALANKIIEEMVKRKMKVAGN